MPTDRPHNLLIEFFSGHPPPETVRAIEAWAREDPANARVLAELIMLDGLMLVDQKNQDAAAVLAVLLEAEQQAPLHLTEIGEQDQPRGLAYLYRDPNSRLFAVAAVLLLVCSLGIWLLSSVLSGAGEPERTASVANPQVPPPVVATLTGQHDAEWRVRTGETAPSVGGGLYADQALVLTEGFAEITTGRGAVVLLEAPCKIEILGENQVRLAEGRLVGRCQTPRSKGFTVHTPGAWVTDLGTVFGVFVDESESTLAKVFEGEVEVAAADGRSTPAKKLARAESIALDAAGREVPRASLEEQPFASLAAIEAGIVDASDSIRFVPVRPDRLSKNSHTSDTEVFVFEESDGVRLPGDVGVSITQPGRYDRFLPENTPRQLIQEGTLIRSFVIRADAASAGRRYHGRLTFDQPIIGVMTGTQDWAAYASLMPEQAIALEMQPYLIEGVDNEWGTPDKADWLRLHPDGHTLEFGMFVGDGDDHFRVFVAVPDGASGLDR